jgi:hypothetical protein
MSGKIFEMRVYSDNTHEAVKIAQAVSDALGYAQRLFKVEDNEGYILVAYDSQENLYKGEQGR